MRRGEVVLLTGGLSSPGFGRGERGTTRIFHPRNWGCFRTGNTPGKHFTIKDFSATTCVDCGHYGQFLHLPTCTRCCYPFLTRSPKYFPLFNGGRFRFGNGRQWGGGRTTPQQPRRNGGVCVWVWVCIHTHIYTYLYIYIEHGIIPCYNGVWVGGRWSGPKASTMANSLDHLTKTCDFLPFNRDFRPEAHQRMTINEVCRADNVSVSQNMYIIDIYIPNLILKEFLERNKTRERKEDARHTFSSLNLSRI